MPQTILDVLVKPNPTLDSGSVPAGPNTYSNDWIPVTDWQPWVDFTYDNLLSIFRQPLNSTWRAPPPTVDMAAGFDSYICDERSLDFFLVKYIWPHVNAALREANYILEWGREAFYLGTGSWCHGDGSPDWSLVSNLRKSEGRFWNLLPGDTKLSAKWRPDMEQSSNATERQQWTLPLSQVNTYAAESACRYGFIITDEMLVALRFTRERVGDGLASTRSTRITHQRYASGDTDLSSVMESMSLDSFGAQSYVEDDLANAANSEFLPPEFAMIPQAAHGRGQLTVKLSLFCLCLMAAGENGRVGYDYPPLDSWRQESRHRFVHNTSGRVAARLPANATLCGLQEPQQDATSAGPSNYLASENEDAVTGQDTQTNLSAHSESTRKVTRVEVKKRDGLFCFYDRKKKLRKTRRLEWIRNQDPHGWIYQGEKYMYFTEHLP
ncbi:hypothetical protein HIM_10657 [Hirsutella minnesotensis 3608]|uniref:Uncharacterized protein n=1 Tax=Hirsutella minnesotensis 3608 TaxID=1043627 RepID=A0A0F8A214_9HYPO|nr:hypothetical protein HIM_10657 [Hirsutella minnesotensis 3608]